MPRRKRQGRLAASRSTFPSRSSAAAARQERLRKLPPSPSPSRRRRKSRRSPRRLRRRRLQRRRRRGGARAAARTERRSRPPLQTAPRRSPTPGRLQRPSPPRRTAISTTSRWPSGPTSWSRRVSYTADSRAPSPRFHAMSSYAIISLGGKQYRVSEGERLLVDRLGVDEGATLEPRVLLVGGNGAPDLSPSTTVTARVVGHELGKKIRIGKYRRRTGYKKHTGHRSKLTRIEIESIGAAKTAAKAAAKPKAEKAEEKPAPKAEQQPTGELPEGYASMTIAQLSEAAGGWSREQTEAALEHERSGKARKGALAALESALEEK